MRTLGHLGRPATVAALPHAVLFRAIPNAPHEDVLAPWPYGSAPDTDALPEAFARLRDGGAVTFTGILRPDARIDAEAARRAGFATVPLKRHFIVDGARDLPAFSRKTRRNLAIAARHWAIAVTAPTPEQAEEAARLHTSLQRRRALSAMTRMPADHFRRLAGVPGIAVVTARDAEGIGGMLVAARDAGETHLLHILLDERALRTCASYLLMASAIELWGRDGRLYLGGAPAGPDGPGIARFKARWANRTAPVSLLTAVLREDVYRDLSSRHAATPYFPAYRSPEGEERPA
ncbi:MAG TPA: hypothetical protein VGE72_16475 [Azospirillum sp.]